MVLSSFGFVSPLVGPMLDDVFTSGFRAWLFQLRQPLLEQLLELESVVASSSDLHRQRDESHRE